MRSSMGRALIVAMMPTLWSFSAQPMESPRVRQSLMLAQQALEKGYYPEALKHFLKVLELSPGHLEAKKGVLEISQAVAKWERATELKPGEWEFVRKQSLKAMQERKAKAAQMSSQLSTIAEVLGSKNQKSLFAASLSLTKSSQEDFQDVHFMAQAKIYLTQLQERFRDALSQGSISDPKDLRLAKGFLYYHKGLLESALEEWQGALSLDPSDSILQQQVGWLGDRIKKDKERQQLAHLTQQAQQWFKAGAYERAIEDWTQVLALNPRHEQAISGLANAQAKVKEQALHKQLDKAHRTAKSGRPLDALQQWVAVLEIDPSNAEALAAVQEWREKQPKTALASMAPVSSESFERKPLEAEEQYAIGMAYYAQRELTPALEAMERALRLDPKLRKAQVAVERIRAELGQ